VVTVTVIVRETIASVRIAVDTGAQTAKKSLVSTLVLPRPLPNLEVVFPMVVASASWLKANRNSRVSNQTLVLSETRGSGHG